MDTCAVTRPFESSGQDGRRSAWRRPKQAGHSTVNAEPANATFFCDECGYTGADWMNPDQQVFVHGGWLVPDAARDSLEGEISAIRREYRINVAELKWKRLRRRSDASQVFSSFFDLLLRNGCIPIFLVADKAFLTAAKIIETYFDPAYNHHLDDSFTGDFDTKRQLAETVYADEPLLEAFATMFLRGSGPAPEEVSQVASRVQHLLIDAGRYDYASLLSDFPPDALEDVRDEFTVEGWRKTTTAHTLWAVLQLLEQTVRGTPLEVTIVHDQVLRFDALFGEVEVMFGRLDSEPALSIDGRIRYTSMPTVSGLTLGDSKTDVFLQLADLLCGFVAGVTLKVKRGEALSSEEGDVLFHLAGLFQTLEPWNGNLPTSLFAELFRPWFERLAAFKARAEPLH